MKNSPLISGIILSKFRSRYSSRNVLIFEILILILFCSSTLIVALNNAGPLMFDEFYHFLAARSWAENGTLAIGDGAYVRAWLFTKTVGIAFGLLGESIHVARSVPVLGGVAWSLIVFLWSRFFLGRDVAWIAVIMFVFSNVFFHLSTFVRFYTWHGFFIFSAFALGTILLSQPRKSIYSYFLLLFAFISILIAYHLQESTLIAITGFSLFLMLFYYKFIKNILVKIFQNKRYLLFSVLLLAAVVILSWMIDLPQYLWFKYSHTALWLENVSPAIYRWYFEKNYPLFWSIFPVMAFWAAVNRPPYGLACVIIFSTSFLLHTFAGMRDIRYLAYALPFFFIIASISIVSVIKALNNAISTADLKYLNSYLTLHRLTFPMISLLIFITFSFSIIVNSGFREAYQIMLRQRGVQADWSSYSHALKQLAKSVDVVVVTYGVAGFYYIGDIDYVMSRTIMLETDSGEEFGYDKRIGRRVIGSLNSLKMIMDCYPSGLIVIDRWRWGDPLRGTDSKINSFIIENTSPVSLIDDDILYTYVWRNDVSIGKKSDCYKIQNPSR
jgi:hypothetical protein